MSLSRTCVFAQTEDGKWYLLLAVREYGTLQDDCSCDGPFPTVEKAEEYLHDSYSNPGSSYEVEAADLTPRMRELIAKARKPDYSNRWF